MCVNVAMAKVLHSLKLVHGPLYSDDIQEKTLNHGVIIEGTTLKDNNVTTTGSVACVKAAINQAIGTEALEVTGNIQCTKLGVGTTPSVNDAINVLGDVTVTGNLTTTGGLSFPGLKSLGNNECVGLEAGQVLSNEVGNTNSANTFVGSYAGHDAKDNNLNNTFVGSSAGAVATGTTEVQVKGNTAVGAHALEASVSGNDNTAIGASALAATTTGEQTAVGSEALMNTTTGLRNTGVGVRSGKANTTGTDNTFVGFQAGLDATGSTNTGVGGGTLSKATASQLTAVGHDALYENTTGQYNTAVGFMAGTNNVEGTHNAFVGHSAGSQSTANGNTALGSQSLRLTTSGANNSAVGYSALEANTTGANNTAVGMGASHDNDVGVDNTCVGSNAGKSLKSHYNVAIGSDALKNFVGDPATSVDRNTVVGAYAGSGWTSGQYNTCVGTSAGRYVTDPVGCVFIGNDTGAATGTATRQIVIGQGSQPAENGTEVIVVGAGITGSGSNSINIGCGDDTAANSINIGTLNTHNKLIVHSLAEKPAASSDGGYPTLGYDGNHQIYFRQNPFITTQLSSLDLSENDYTLNWDANNLAEVVIVTATKSDGTSRFDMHHNNSYSIYDGRRYTIVNKSANVLKVGCSNWSRFDLQADASWCGYDIPPLGSIQTVYTSPDGHSGPIVITVSDGAVWSPTPKDTYGSIASRALDPAFLLKTADGTTKGILAHCRAWGQYFAYSPAGSICLRNEDPDNVIQIGCGSGPAPLYVGTHITGVQIYTGLFVQSNIGINTTGAATEALDVVGNAKITGSLTLTPESVYGQSTMLPLCADGTGKVIRNTAWFLPLNLTDQGYEFKWEEPEIIMVRTSSTPTIARIRMNHVNTDTTHNGKKYTIKNMSVNPIQVGCTNSLHFDYHYNSGFYGFQVEPQGYISVVYVSYTDNGVYSGPIVTSLSVGGTEISEA